MGKGIIYMVDPVFGTNDYGKPKMLTENQTLANNFLMLLLGKPGFFPSLPMIGIDISRYLYMFVDDINIDELKSKIAVQCTDFLPAIRQGDFDIQKTTFRDRTLLMFSLPAISDTNNVPVMLGVTTDTSGNVIYRFVEGKTQIL